MASLACLALGLALAGGVALADKKESVQDGDKMDISKISGDIVMAHDGNGHYIAALPGVNTYELFFGDGKTFHKQIVQGGGGDSSKGETSWTYFEPRLKGRGALKKEKTVWTVDCEDRKIKFNTISAKETKKLIKKAKFKPFKFKRQPYALLRNEKGIYYFIDRDRTEGKGYRLYAGRRGNMKKFKLVDIVDDSEGQIFITNKGDLHFMLNSDKEGDLTWVKGAKAKTNLKRVPIYKNRLLIYTDLGPYENERVGTPCDEL